MKTSILVVAISILSIASGYGQQGNFTVGVNAGIPVGDFEELSSFNLGADVAYRYDIIAEQFAVGALVGYSHFFGESGEDEWGSWEVDDVQFLPVAASARVQMNSFFAGAEVGYAIGINDGNEGGFYYRPHAGYNFAGVGVIASYSAVNNDDFTVATLNLGLEFRF